MNRIIDWVSTNDIQLFQLINQQLRCRLLNYTLPKITHVGGAAFSIMSMVLLIVLSAAPVSFWALQALLSLTMSHVIVHVIKKIYCRERPYTKLTTVFFTTEPLKDYSFPSGHSTAAFSIAVVFALHSALLAALLLPIASLVALSRMYLGLHYPTDCIIGILIGTICSTTIVYLGSF